MPIRTHIIYVPMSKPNVQPEIEIPVVALVCWLCIGHLEVPAVGIICNMIITSPVTESIS